MRIELSGLPTYPNHFIQKILFNSTYYLELNLTKREFRFLHLTAKIIKIQEV